MTWMFDYQAQPRFRKGARTLFLVAVCILSLGLEEQRASQQERVRIPAGDLTPQYAGRESGGSLPVGSFSIDTVPVTNQRFLSFVSEHGEWSPQSVPAAFAEQGYLSHWIGAPGKQAPRQNDLRKPVVNVSYFASAAYCKAHGGRLPTVLEWEYVAAADEKSADATKDPVFVQRILDWYAAPPSPDGIANVGGSTPNIYGVKDLHGLVWEWTKDFNSVFINTDNRDEGGKNLFCGSASQAAANREDYAAFMRYAFRSSLTGRSVGKQLGFRCAYD